MSYREIEQRNIKAFSKALISRIDELCIKNKMTISEWTINSGITPSTIYDFKSGKTVSLNIITIKKLCDTIDLPLSVFFDTKNFNDIDFDE